MQQKLIELSEYGIATGLIQESDQIYVLNQLLALCLQEGLEEDMQLALEQRSFAFTSAQEAIEALEGILAKLLDAAYASGILEDNYVTSRDLFDTKLMGVLVERPSQIIEKFNRLYVKDPKEATDYYYNLSCTTDYIRTYRIKKDLKWTTQTKYGVLDITVNLSKPEKDPKAIAAAKHAKQSGYPKCLLCKENEGYGGRIDHPARQNHRILPIRINDSEWFFQYSPYVYYNEHCIVFHSKHQPMKIEKATFAKLLDFVEAFPHYFVGSNADLPIVGGSILSHDHFQGGNYEFAMAKANIEEKVTFSQFPLVEAGIVKWPMSVIRLTSEDKESLIQLSDCILSAWRSYSDEEAFIFAATDGEPHNTITPIARKREGKFEMDLVLRNNITTKEHPFGVYHPHSNLHHIKKENIGLIEVMGLAVLPARLKEEMAELEVALLNQESIEDNERLAKHQEWVDTFTQKYEQKGITFSQQNLNTIINEEIGLVFEQVLEDAGVYPCTKEGRTSFQKFLQSVK